MTSFKQSIAWTAVLLYHWLKLAALTSNRHTLRPTTFRTEIIYKIASFFRTTLEYIYKIVGVNGRNTNRIHNRALTDSRFYEIEFYLCKKVDKHIFNCNTTTTIITRQLQPPKSFSALSPLADNSCNSIVATTQTSLYLLRHLIMPKHDSIYFAMELP